MKKEVEYYVYVLETEGDFDIFYVGKGKGNRCKEHRHRAKKGKQNYHVYNKIRKLWRDGGDYRYRIVFKTNDEQLAYDKEKELIALFGRENLCNLSDGGDGSGFKSHTEETKKKIGDKNRGRKHTPETLELMKRVHTGVRLTDEEKQHLKDITWSSPERLAHLRKQALNRAKSVINVDTGEVFITITSAAKSVNMSPNALTIAIKANRPFGGFRWEFIQPVP